VTIVVDASVAMKWFVNETYHDEALRLLNQVGRFQAPDLIVAEVANIAWKKCLRDEIVANHARTIAATVHHYVPILRSATEFAERAIEIALMLEHPVYDCLYIACAEKTDGTLVTADDRLCRTVDNTPFSSRVVSIRDADGLDI